MQVRKKYKNAWTDEQIALLGTDTDKAIATLLGKKQNSVAHNRIKRGIPPKDPKRSQKNVWEKTEEEDSLGKLPDSVIAERLGIAIASVTLARQRRGIPSYTDSHKTNWENLKNLPQPEFFKALKELSGGTLTYKKLSDMTHVSYSRCQKWFASGTGQEPLCLQIRRHMYLEVLFERTN